MNDYLKKRQEHINAGRPLAQKKSYSIPKKSEKRIAKEKEQRESGGDNALDLWFDARRKEMKGVCVLCGGKSEKHNDATYRRSIHHLFDKKPSLYPSVATNPDNWLEVCHFGNSCHDNIHNRTITWELLHDSAEWSIIVSKFKKIFPFMAEGERKNIHPLLLKELDNTP